MGFVARLHIQMWLFWARSVPWREVLWEAAGIVPLSIASLAYGAARVEKPINVGSYLWFLTSLFGTWANIWPEWQRHRWKRHPANAGRLYTGSLFAYARHINYTGEILSF